MLFYFYIITNLKNQKIYVGITNNPKTRWNTHKNIANGGKEKFPKHYQAIHTAISLYGEENFIMEVSQIFSDEDEAYQAEIYWIDYLRQMKVPNYNIAGGGKGTGSGANHPMFGKTLPPEWAAKTAIASKINANKLEVKEKHSKNMIKRNWVGENHPMFGKTHTSEAKEKISKARKGRKFSEEHKAKIGASRKGKKMSEKARQNMRAAQKGKNIGFNNGNATLSKQDVEEILKLVEQGTSRKDLAKKFNVHIKTISIHIRKNKKNAK